MYFDLCPVDQKKLSLTLKLWILLLLDLYLFDHEHHRCSDLTVDCWTIDFLFDHGQRSECTTLHDVDVNATPF